MPNTPQLKFNEADNTFAPDNPTVGITAVLIEAKRGEINNSSEVFTGWEAYRKKHGGLVSGNFGPWVAKRALERGSAIRVINIKHYSDIEAGTLAATKSTAASSALVSLSDELAAGHEITVTVNGTDNVQPFSLSSENTLDLLCAKIRALTGVVQDAFSFRNNSIIVIPKPGVVLVVTAGVTGAGAPAATVATEATLEDTAGNTIFSFQPKYAGADYDNIVVHILPASNGDVNAFNVRIIHTVETDLSETHENLKIIGKPTIAQSTYLDKIKNESKFLEPVYQDLSSIVGVQIVPRKFAIRYQNGSDGGAATDTDYIGSPASKTGLYALDGISDISQFIIPLKSSVAILQAAANYAAARGDLQFFGWLGNFTTEQAAADARDLTLIDTKYCQLYAQYITSPNPLDSVSTNVSPMGDIVGAADYNDANFFPWYSFAGKNRGRILGASSVPNNFGTKGNLANLNLLANRQVNVVVNEGRRIYIKSNFTAQVDNSQYSFGNVTRFIIYLKKDLGPLIETFIEEPNDFFTWKRMYMVVKPRLNFYGKNRALYGEEGQGWSWQGDQFANSLADLKINDPADVALGKYKANLFLKVVPALIEIGIGIILSPSGVSFEDLLTENINNQL